MKGNICGPRNNTHPLSPETFAAHLTLKPQPTMSDAKGVVSVEFYTDILCKPLDDFAPKDRYHDIPAIQPWGV